MKYIILCGALVLSLGGCSMVTSGIVGAAVAPLVQPIIDRALVQIGLDIIDPAGTTAVKPQVQN